MEKITFELSHDQAWTLRELVQEARVDIARSIVTSDRPDRKSEPLAYMKRLETTLVSQMTKTQNNS